MLTRAEACSELGMSRSTLDRRIAAGDLKTKREPHRTRHRVYVMLDDDPPDTHNRDGSGDTAVAVAQERIRGLEWQMGLLREQLEYEQQHNAGLANELRTARERNHSRRRFWPRVNGRAFTAGL